MFSRSQRIPSVLFSEILKKGISFRSTHFLLVVLRGAAMGPKIGVVVPKKTAAKAVKRNRLRRQARVWVKNYTAGRVQSNVNMVLFINTDWQGPFPILLQEELRGLFPKARVMA